LSSSATSVFLVRKHIFIDIYMDLSVTIYFPACEGYVTAYAVQVK